MGVQQRALGLPFKGRFAARRLKLRYVVLVAALGLVVAHAVLGLALLRQSQAQQQVESDSAILRRTLRADRGETLEQLQGQLEEVQTELAAVERAFPDQVRVNTFLTTLLELAQTHGVRVVSFQARRSSEQMVGQHTYLLTPFTIGLSGPPSGLVTFLSSLEESHQHTLIIQTAQLTPSQGGAALALEATMYTRPSAKRQEAPASGTPEPVRGAPGR